LPVIAAEEFRARDDTVDPSNAVTVYAQILHWNRPDECLRTTRLLLEQSGLSVTVIDNGSTEENLTKLRSLLPPEVRLIPLSSNAGWGGGHNVGLRLWLEQQTCDFCCIVAHDAIPDRDCIQLLVKAMRENSELGMVCPQYPDRVVATYRPVFGPRTIVVPPQHRGSVQMVDLVHGTLTVVRRQCLKEIGLFDERYFAYGDEMEICLRSRKAGWKAGLIWGAIVVNPGTWTPQPMVTYFSSRNSLLMAREYGGVVCAGIRLLLMLVNTFRLLLTRTPLWVVGARKRAMADFIFGRFGAPAAFKRIPKRVSK
jgi:N-acetylglucosaminyl-diphospho-decaprenol L-rhamnosyltransferase